MTKKTLACVAMVGVTVAGFGTFAQAQNLQGTISIDGSSTVYPITEAVAEEFSEDNPNVRVTVGISGTGKGFERFVDGQTDISDASRPIKTDEISKAEAKGIEFIEIPVAYDGLTVVVNPNNKFVDQLTVDQLKKIFGAENSAKTWKDVNPAWPAEPIKIYSPGTASGTFEYFKEETVGKKGDMRSDMSVSEDDNVLVRGVSGDPNAIGYFGYAYFEENSKQLRAVPIVNPKKADAGAIMPSPETIESGAYAPFSRPLFIYVSQASMQKPHVKEFVEFYLKEVPDLASDVGYVSLPKNVYAAVEKRVEAGTTGTAYLKDGKKVEGTVADVYGAK